VIELDCSLDTQYLRKKSIEVSMPKMRVMQVTQPKGPFELVEREISEPGAGAVRIRVRLTTQRGVFPGIQYPTVGT